MSTSERAQNLIPDIVINGLILLRRSLLLSVFVLGIVCIGLAALVFNGVLAGMFAAWGISLVIVSAVSYALLWFNRYR